MKVQTFFDQPTWTLTYVVWDEKTRDAVVIDPVLDYDPLRIQVDERSIDELERFVRENELTVRYVLDTHAHADHLSGAAALGERLGAPIGIGAHIKQVQAAFAALFGSRDVVPDGSAWDVLVDDGEVLQAGSLRIEAIHTPGHTPACTTYRIGDALFTGDALFMPDFGTGRCDFPGGSAADLYDSVQKLYALPDDTEVYVGHDYQPGGRELAYRTTIGESKEENIQLKGDTSREDFIRFREARDAQLSPPNLILQSLQINIRAGRLPPPAENGRRYLLLPMDVFR